MTRSVNAGVSATLAAVAYFVIASVASAVFIFVFDWFDPKWGPGYSFRIDLTFHAVIAVVGGVEHLVVGGLAGHTLGRADIPLAVPLVSGGAFAGVYAAVGAITIMWRQVGASSLEDWAPAANLVWLILGSFVTSVAAFMWFHKRDKLPDAA